MDVETASRAYADLLTISHASVERAKAGRALAFLRDFIAERTGRDPEEVQSAFEEVPIPSVPA